MQAEAYVDEEKGRDAESKERLEESKGHFEKAAVCFEMLGLIGDAVRVRGRLSQWIYAAGQQPQILITYSSLIPLQNCGTSTDSQAKQRNYTIMQANLSKLHSAMLLLECMTKAQWCCVTVMSSASSFSI